MRSALLSLCLAALLGGGNSRPPTSSFLFPDELPTSRDVEDHDYPTPLRSKKPPMQRLWDHIRFVEDPSVTTSGKISTEVLSGLETEMLPVGPSTDSEKAESTGNSSGGFLVPSDLVRPEVGEPDLGNEVPQQVVERITETRHLEPRAGGGSAPGSTQSVTTDPQSTQSTPPDSHVTNISGDSSSDVGIVTGDPMPVQSGTAPDFIVPAEEESLLDPVSFSSAHQPSTTTQTLNSSSSVSPAVTNTSSRASAGRAVLSTILLFPDSFPDSSDAAQPTGPVLPLPSCDGERVSAIHPVTGRCQLLGDASDCPDGTFFMLSPAGTDPSCRLLPCPEDQLLVGDVCLLAEDLSACPPGMSLVMDERGRGRCDCRPGHVFWPADRRCYPAFTQGPCSVGQQLTAPLDEPRPRCAQNLCMLDGSWLWRQPPAKRCYMLLTPEAGCESQLMLTLSDGRIVCDPGVFLQRSLFDLPSIRCDSDELMDYGGRCRSSMRQGFRQ